MQSNYLRMIVFGEGLLVYARIIGCIIGLVSVGCDASTRIGTTSVDSSGVHIVTNRPTSILLSWTLDTLRLIGGAETGPAAFYLLRPALVDVDASDRIYVLDATQYRVAVFNSKGKPMGTMGRRGSGPGELAGPIAITATPNGEVLVLDGGRGVVVRYNRGGALVEEWPYPFGIVNINFRHTEATAAGVAMWARDLFSGDRPRYDRLLWVVESDTVMLGGQTPAHRSTAHYPECGTTYTIAVPLSPTLEWSQAGERLAVASPTAYQIDIFEGGGLRRSVRVRSEVLAVNRAGAERILARTGAQGPCGADARQLVSRHGFHERVQVVRGVALSPDGSMWVQQRGADGEERIDVFDPDGEQVGRLPVEFPMPLTFLSDGRLVTVITDSLDVQRVGILQVQR